jgi:hypothetical protein
MEWDSEPPKTLILDITWKAGEIRRVESESNVCEKISFLETQYTYVGSIMHTMIPSHFYAVVSFEGRVWGPPLDANGYIDYPNDTVYVPRGNLPHVTPDGKGYSVLHCYVLEDSEEDEDLSKCGSPR